MGIVNYLKRRKSLRKLHDVGSVFKTLDKLEESSMLSFDIKNRRLFIEEPLALLMMAGGAEKWTNFMQNCFAWLYHRQCSEAWDKFFLKEELAAVRKASKTFTAMKRADIERVRRARRDEIVQSDMQPPKVEPFEFFVVRTKWEDGAAAEPQPTENGKSKADDGKGKAGDNKGKANGGKPKAVPAGEIIAVGNYDPDMESLEMAAWEDVKQFFKHD